MKRGFPCVEVEGQNKKTPRLTEGGDAGARRRRRLLNDVGAGGQYDPVRQKSFNLIEKPMVIPGVRPIAGMGKRFYPD
jgi:hypothetical protein